MVESRTHNPKVVGSSLGPAGIVVGGSECTALSPPLIPWLRCPWARHRTPICSPGCPLLRVCVHGVCVSQCVCVCSLLCVCTLDGLDAEHTFWVWVTILGCMSRLFHFQFDLCTVCVRTWHNSLNYLQWPQKVFECLRRNYKWMNQIWILSIWFMLLL